MIDPKTNDSNDTTTARPDAEKDSIDRRGLLKCMAWAGTGLLWTLEAGIPSSKLLAGPAKKAAAGSNFSFVQISGSHIGVNKPANPDVTATMRLRLPRSMSCRISRIS